MPSSSLVLGPLLRHCDTTSAVIWVEVDRRATVTVVVDGRRHDAPTFCVHDHHYAVVDVDGLAPGTDEPYAVEVDGERVWPPGPHERGGSFPPSRLATRAGDASLHFLYGSCRTSVPHDVEHHRTHGVDVLRAYALDLASHPEERPDFLLLLGDQVYADETSDAMRRFIAARRSLEEPPGEELSDFVEYAHLYLLAWSDPGNRWLLSTLSTLMIFDDHDVRDDWNTSADWRESIERLPWWKGRITAALASYWVYQHLGNLSPSERAEDEMWQCLQELWSRGEDDLTTPLEAFAARVDEHPDGYRWSYVRDLGRSRLVVVDTRAARDLTPGRRQMLDDAEAAWLLEQARGDVDHVFVGTSVPYLLSEALHELEAANESIADGAWGRRTARLAERLRQTVDLEHWGAFQHSFRRVADHARAVAAGEHGSPPATICFLSGDVHHSYLAEVDDALRNPGGGRTRLLQAVCSPIRNPLPTAIRASQRLFQHRGVAAAIRAVSRRAGVDPAPFTWRTTAGPWFENQLASVRVDGVDLDLRWQGAEAGEDGIVPVLRTTHEVHVAGLNR